MMNQELVSRFWQMCRYSCLIGSIVALIGVIINPQSGLMIVAGSILGVGTSLIATYLLYVSASKLVNSDPEDAVAAQLKSYALRFGLYIIAIGITALAKTAIDPLFVIIGFLIPKVAIVIEAWRFNQYTRR